MGKFSQCLGHQAQAKPHNFTPWRKGIIVPGHRRATVKSPCHRSLTCCARGIGALAFDDVPGAGHSLRLKFAPG
jgi:hypothetical protein